MRKIMSAVLVTAMAVSLAACSSAPAETEAPATTAAETEATEAEAPESTEAEAETEAAADGEQQEILVAAAASLQYVMEDALQPAFEEANPDIKLAFTFDSSGKLQTQIEEGADVDVFFSAATKQMNADTIVDLLENKIALIVPAGSETGIRDLRISQRPRESPSAIRRAFRWDSIPRRPSRALACGKRLRPRPASEPT